jgi:integrase/recombinase XerC
VSASVIEQFLEDLRTQRRASAHTVAAYRRDLSSLIKLAAGRLPASLTTHDIRGFVARLHGAGLSPATLARTLSAWRTFFAWLIEHRGLDANPVAGVRAPRREKRLPKALTADQAVRLAAHEGDATWIAARDHALVELMYSSGLRLSELVALDWRHFEAEPGQPRSSSWIDLDSGEATVLGKGSKTRTVPIGSPARAALTRWLAARASIERADARALFVSARGSRLTARSVQSRLAQLARKLGLGVHVHPHVLRHSFASHLLQSSGDLRAVQELLGHANIATTQIYTRLDWQHLAKAYDAAHPRARRKSST